MLSGQTRRRSSARATRLLAQFIGLLLLTGVQPATLARYRTYVAREVDPVFGSMPITAVTESTIAKWVKQLSGSGKTISNKHGFLSGAFNAAVRAGVMASNRCQGRRLPHTRVEETVFLTPPEFRLLRDHIERERWKNLATWLVTTGMRFSEATALTGADIDADAKTCRINKAWKYSGDYRPEIGPPKTKKSIRTISLLPPALEGTRSITALWQRTREWAAATAAR